MAEYVLKIGDLIELSASDAVGKPVCMAGETVGVVSAVDGENIHVLIFDSDSTSIQSKLRGDPIDEDNYLEELEEAREQLRHASATIDRIARHCQRPSAEFTTLERERLRHQTRANVEAVRASDLEYELRASQRAADSKIAALTARVEALSIVAAAAAAVLVNGDLHLQHDIVSRSLRESELRRALDAAGIHPRV